MKRLGFAGSVVASDAIGIAENALSDQLRLLDEVRFRLDDRGIIERALRQLDLLEQGPFMCSCAYRRRLRPAAGDFRIASTSTVCRLVGRVASTENGVEFPSRSRNGAWLIVLTFGEPIDDYGLRD